MPELRARSLAGASFLFSFLLSNFYFVIFYSARRRGHLFLFTWFAAPWQARDLELVACLELVETASPCGLDDNVMRQIMIFLLFI